MGRIHFPESKLQKSAEVLLFALPCVVFLYLAFRFCINAPYWDDFNVILDPIRKALVSNSLADFVIFMLTGRHGHLPLVTHALAWIQVKCFGGINFVWFTIIGDLGAIFGLAVLVFYSHKRYGFRFFELIPMSFILLSIVHWESMHFAQPAWQFYWGCFLLPILFFIAIIERYSFVASVMFFGAIFHASNALLLLPITMLYCVMKKQLKETAFFWLMVILILSLYLRGIAPAGNVVITPELGYTLDFAIAFMGNVVSNGFYKMQSIAWLHKIVGVFVIGAGLYGLLRIKGGELFKLIFVYVLLQPFLAVFTRELEYLPPRYSLFALMGLISVVYLGALHPVFNCNKVLRTRYFLTLMLASILLWIHSVYTCAQPLARNKKLKHDTIVNYQNSRDKSVLTSIISTADSAEFGETLLIDAKNLGVYDFTQYK